MHYSNFHSCEILTFAQRFLRLLKNSLDFQNLGWLLCKEHSESRKEWNCSLKLVKFSQSERREHSKMRRGAHLQGAPLQAKRAVSCKGELYMQTFEKWGRDK